MRSVMLFLILAAGAFAPAHACDITAGPGAVVRYSEGQTGGVASVGCVASKWEVRLWYVGEQRLYHGSISVDGYPALSASRLWTFREGRRIEPILGVGLLVKGADRCAYDGETNCNRQLPLPFAFLATAGVRVGDVVFTLFHASNSSLDHGAEKKNLGLDGLRAEVWF